MHTLIVPKVMPDIPRWPWDADDDGHYDLGFESRSVNTSSPHWSEKGIVLVSYTLD